MSRLEYNILIEKRRMLVFFISTAGFILWLIHWKNGRRGVVQCKSMHFVYATQLICISLQNIFYFFILFYFILFFYCGYPPAKANVWHASGCCCVKGSVVVVSITIQLLLLVYWICLNKTDNKLARLST